MTYKAMNVTAIFIYTFAFLALFVQVFFFITFFESRKKIVPAKKDDRADVDLPSVTIIVPCYNEEKTVEGTVNSLLALNYPKDKLFIKVIDDGSKDDTWIMMQKFAGMPNLELLHKENGGKHTALNWGIKNAATEFVGCLDADSFVHAEALRRIVPFFKNSEVMAVSPSVIVRDPKNIIQKAQKAEYDMAVYIKKMLGFLSAIHVTPGPFSIYRKDVFKKIGYYRKAHNTEDMEIAYRMQTNNLRIEQCHDAFAYTVAPDSVPKLFRQRLRWIYGFINNTIDYRGALFRKKYGNFAFFTVPAGIISIFATMFVFGRIFFKIGDFIVAKFDKLSVLGFDSIFAGLSAPSFDWFFVSTKALLFVMIVIYALIFFAILMGKKMATGKTGLAPSMLYFMVIYSLLAPFWLAKAVINTVARRQPDWR